MSITLRPEHEKLVIEAMQTGAYQDTDDVIGKALEMLHGQNAWLLEHKEDIATKIELAFRQFEHGDFLTAEQSRADMDARKAAWLSERSGG